MKFLINHKLQLDLPPIDFFLQLIYDKKYFKFCKLNHAFWEMLLNKEPALSDFLSLHSPEFIQDCLGIIENMPKNTMLGVSPQLIFLEKGIIVPGYGRPKINYELNEVLQLTTKNQIIVDKIFSVLKSDRPLFFGTIWKHYTHTGVIKKLYTQLRKNPVIVVGLSHLKVIENYSNFFYFKININSNQEKEETLKNLIKFRLKFDGPVTILFQAGELFSLWLINNLDLECTNLIDMGRALDFFCGKIEISEEDRQIYKNMVKNTKFYPKNVENIWRDLNKQAWQKKISLKKFL